MRGVTRVRAVLLDLDGTIADTHELIYRCLNETAREHAGREFPRSVWQEGVGLPLDQLFVRALGPSASEQPASGTLIESYRARQRKYDHSVQAFPQMQATLNELRRRNVRLAVVTTKLQAISRRHLDTMGLADLFDVVVGWDQYSRPKPDPEPFQKALEALGVDAACAAGVGDSQVDVRAARSAGVLAVAACWGTVNRAALLAADPDLIVEQPPDLLQLLE